MTCRGCTKVICRKSECSTFSTKTAILECKTCRDNRNAHHRAGEWILQQLNQKFKIPGIESNELIIQSNDESTFQNVSPKQRERVREFLEDLLSSMLGGSLDDITVGRMYKNDDCKFSFYFKKKINSNHLKLD